MLMNLQKRILITKIFPKTGSLDGQIRAKELAERLRFIPEEYKEKIQYTQNDDGSFQFNPVLDILEEFELSESEKHVLKRGVEALDKEECITFDILDLCKEIKEL